MKSLIILFIATITMWSCSTSEPKESANAKEEFIDSIISGMTLEEKVGQMTNLTVTVLGEDRQDTLILDPQKMDSVLVKRHVGSIQNVHGHGYPIEQWHSIVNGIQKVVLEKSSHKIPNLYCIDAVHGTNYTLGSTLFPHNIALAATRDRKIVNQGAKVTAMEARASGIRYNFSPVLDVGRHPLWSRYPETFGEDTYICAEMGAASVEGYEQGDVSSNKAVAATGKHFVGYSVPSSGKDRSPALIPEIVLREHFLPSFQQAVDLDVKTIMVNSGEVNGVPLHSSKYLLTDVLRGELGFKGVLISDWEDVKKLQYRHRVAANHKEAVFQTVNAGIDLVIVPFDFSFTDDLIALVNEGRISEERIDESVRRVLSLKYDVGLWDDPYVEKEALENFKRPEYKQYSLTAAEESITLLKNKDNALPLDLLEGVVVTGPFANKLTNLNGCWSYTWQGLEAQWYDPDMKNIVESISAIGSNAMHIPSKGSELLKSIPAGTETIVICLGEDAYAETPGDINDLTLDQDQLGLVKVLAESGRKIVIVLTEGRPRIIKEIEPLADAIIMAYWPGEMGGPAIARTLYGLNNPSGRLPFTYPRYTGDIKTYDHKLSDETGDPTNDYDYAYNPQWPFGYGLSYTSFEYSDLSCADTMKAGDTLEISVTLKNTGSRKGKHSVELYTRDLYASITPPVKRLRNFEFTELGPGEDVQIKFSLTKDGLKFVGRDLKWVTEEGEFEVMVGGLKKNFYYLP